MIPCVLYAQFARALPGPVALDKVGSVGAGLKIQI